MSTAIEIVAGEIVEPEGEPLPQEIANRRKMRRLEKISVESIERFLDRYAETGLIAKSADYAGLHYVTVSRLMKNDETMAELASEALQIYREALQVECHRRAVEGWEEPVFSQKLGTRIGTIQKYDSRLLELMLKRHIPEFREKFEGELKVTGGVLIAPAPAASSADWASQYAGPVLSTYATPEAPALPAATPPAAPPPAGK